MGAWFIRYAAFSIVTSSHVYIEKENRKAMTSRTDQWLSIRYPLLLPLVEPWMKTWMPEFFFTCRREMSLKTKIKEKGERWTILFTEACRG